MWKGTLDFREEISVGSFYHYNLISFRICTGTARIQNFIRYVTGICTMEIVQGSLKERRVEIRIFFITLFYTARCFERSVDGITMVVVYESVCTCKRTMRACRRWAELVVRDFLDVGWKSRPNCWSNCSLLSNNHKHRSRDFLECIFGYWKRAVLSYAVSINDILLGNRWQGMHWILHYYYLTIPSYVISAVIIGFFL